MKPKFSIITATFNSELTLVDTIESVLNQEVESLEYILIDGNSSDSTVDIIKSYEQKFIDKGYVYKWISESDTGIYNAWNKGLNLVSSPWVAFLGSDDYYTQGALKKYSEMLSKDGIQNYDFIYSEVDQIDDLKKTVREIKGEWSWKVFIRHMNIAHVGAFHNMCYFEKYGRFEESFKIAGDYELLLRAKENLNVKKINFVSAKMRIGGVSNSFISKVFKETLYAKNKTGGLTLFICQYDYIISLIKYYVKKSIHEIIR